MSAILVALSVVACAALPAPGASVPFTPIARGPLSRIVHPQAVVIDSASEWQALWSRHAPTTPRPAVDFSTDVVVGVFAGERRTAGHGVEIVAIERGASEVVVAYRVTEPPRDAMVAQMLTAPFHLVRLPRQGLPFRFARQ